MKRYESFEEAVSDIDSATSVEAINAIVDTINTLFEADALEVSPKQWAMLCSITLFRAGKIS